MDEIIENELIESKEVSKVVKGFIESEAYRKRNLVLEGVALLPEFFEKEFIQTYGIKFLCIGNTDYDTFVEYSWNHRSEGDWMENFNEETFKKVIRFCSELSKKFKEQSEDRGVDYFEINSDNFVTRINEISSTIH